ncbi:thiamine biosynthesis protein, partial [Dissulfurirhabdus thermomarina]
MATGIVLFSGGLDSILACRLLMEQGVRVTALRFITPFFGHGIKGGEAAEAERVRRAYGIELRVEDVSVPYLELVKAPPHGYGRYMNPCIDCKIFMIREALARLEPLGADFVATGEVVGQRPMSQRRDTLRHIEKAAGAEGRLLRPLCARRLPPTRPELEGLVDRERLLGIAGRGRKEQMALATRYGIRDYPTPAGGCVLADPILSRRFRRLFDLWPDFGVADAVRAQLGRQFLLPGGSWLLVGRNRDENARILALAGPEDLTLRLADRPGPLGLLARRGEAADEELAARI